MSEKKRSRIGTLITGLSLVVASACGYHYNLDVVDLAARRLPDKKVAVDVTIGCQETGQDCASSYCVQVQWFSDEAKTVKLDEITDCQSLPATATRALQDNESRIYSFTSDNEIVATPVYVRAEVVIPAGTKGLGYTEPKEITLP